MPLQPGAARALTLPPDDAADVVQEVFTAVALGLLVVIKLVAERDLLPEGDVWMVSLQ